MDHKKVLDFAMAVGDNLVSNGCSSQQVENILKMILTAKDYTRHDIFVTGYCIILTIDVPGSGATTVVRNVSKKRMHAEQIALFEDVANNFVAGNLTAEEAIKKVTDISRRNTYSFTTIALAFGGASAFRTLMFGGSILDGVTSFFVGLCAGIFIQTLNAQRLASVLVAGCGGFVVGFLSVLLMRFGMGTYLDKIIIGALIPFAPGVPFVHAVNDFVNGDNVSGNLRAMEAIFTGISLSGGIAFALYVWSALSKGGVFVS